MSGTPKMTDEQLVEQSGPIVAGLIGLRFHFEQDERTSPTFMDQMDAAIAWVNAAARRIEEQAAALKLWSCPRCRGTGTYEGRCPDPQCGDSTWDHECGGPTLQCTAPACVATRQILSSK